MLNQWIFKSCIISLFFLNTSVTFAGKGDTPPLEKELSQLLSQLPKEQLVQRLEWLPPKLQKEILEHLLLPPIMDKLQLFNPWKKVLIKNLDQLPDELQRITLADLFSPTKERLLSMPKPKENADRIWSAHTDKINSIVISPDGKTLASASDDKTVKLWNLRSGEVEKTLIHEGKVKSIAFSPDGKTLASGTDDHTIQLWNTESGDLERTLTSHKRTVNCIAFSPDGQTLASGSEDKTLKLWDIKSGKATDSLRRDNPITSITFSPDGKMLALGVRQRVILFNVKSKEIIERLPCIYGINSIAFSPDGKTVAAVTNYGTLTIWDTVSWKEVDNKKNKNQYICSYHQIDQAHSVAVSPTGKALAVGLQERMTRDSITKKETGRIDFWSGKNRQVEQILRYPHPIQSVAFSPDGRILVAGSMDGSIAFWDLFDSDILKTLDHPEYHLTPSQSFLLYLLSESPGENRIADWDRHFEEEYGANRPLLLRVKESYESLPENLKSLVKEGFNVIES